MEKCKVEKVSVPLKAMAGYEFIPLDYTDAFRVRLVADSQLSIEELALHVFGEIESYPVYVRLLLKLRDFLVRPFGLKTAADMEKMTKAGDWIGFFRIYRCSEDEIIIGADDRHLDVRASLLRTIHNDRPSLTVSTLVRWNNLLGKIYFTVIKPFHLIIIPATIKRSMMRMNAAFR